MDNDLTDEDLEQNDWYIVIDTLYLPSESMYEQPRKIQMRIIQGEKPQ